MVGGIKCCSRVVDGWVVAVDVDVDDWQSLFVDDKPDPDDDRSIGDVDKFLCSTTDGLIPADDDTNSASGGVHGLLDVWMSEWLSIASVDIAVDIAAGIAADANDILNCQHADVHPFHLKTQLTCE